MEVFLQVFLGKFEQFVEQRQSKVDDDLANEEWDMNC